MLPNPLRTTSLFMIEHGILWLPAAKIRGGGYPDLPCDFKDWDVFEHQGVFYEVQGYDRKHDRYWVEQVVNTIPGAA